MPNTQGISRPENGTIAMRPDGLGFDEG